MRSGGPTMHSANIYALHGFLGRPEDWKQFKAISHPVELRHPELDFWAWAKQFNSGIKKDSEKNILLGYSLGGRLAMHALLENPALWDGAIFVSAHPGLASLEERSLRLESDKLWSERFLKDSWDNLMVDWNVNSIFGGHPFPLPKNEADFDRKALALQLANWSSGKQPCLLPDLEKISIPMLYVAGKCDVKYCQVAEMFKPFSEVTLISEAAHRVPWDQPDEFMQRIKKWFKLHQI
jgi:2-succinyl-6-hydroxy-2,4-cyclohexadiene-1-carboxylate synthase